MDSEAMQPLISVIMPTYNSEATLALSLESLRRQSLRGAIVEVLVIDGGSTDKTRAIAAEFGCRIFDNPRTQPEYAKSIGITQALGKYAVFLDSDEVLCSDRSLEHKVAVLESHNAVRNVVTAGLKTPLGFSAISEYVNSFGEPFSYFMYRIDGSDYARSLKERYTVWHEDERTLIVEFKDNDVLPICDGGGHCFDLEYLKKIGDVNSPGTVSVVFPRMAQSTRKLAVVKNDYTLHFSTATMRGIINKINWRIVINVHECTGTEGFKQRQRLSPRRFATKKYLFMLYAASILGPMSDAIRLAWTKKSWAFLLHLPLTVYLAGFILYQYLLKVIHVRPALKSYGS